MAKGKVTDQEIYAMKGMQSDGMSVKEIAEQLSRSEATVLKYIEQEATEEKDYSDGGYTDKKDTTMFIKDTGAKRNNGVTIMTDGESTRSDMTRDKRVGNIMPNLRKNIHKISKDA